MTSKSFLLFVLITLIFLNSNMTFAVAPFKKAFDAKYVKESGDEDFRKTFKKTGCYTCHVRGKKKDFVNAYGWELAELIEGSAKDRIAAAKKNGKEAKKEEENKLVKELDVALQKVEAVKNPSGETYGELFKAHGLPTADGAKSLRQLTP